MPVDHPESKTKSTTGHTLSVWRGIPVAATGDGIGSPAMRRLGILTTALVLALALAVAAAAKPAPVKFKTGTYAAKTSQGGHFRFKIEGHTAADHCGSVASPPCFIAISYPTITEPCPTGPAGGGMFSVPNGFVNGK